MKTKLCCERYLGLLGVEAEEPSHEALARLVSAQLTQVPFENVSKLYYLKRYGLRNVPTFEQYLDGIEHFNFGGTCYTNNYFLHLLLARLGYRVSLCGADMAEPDVHLVNIVTVDGREYLVDAGYAAPFVKPIPRDEPSDYEIRLGRDRYVLNPIDENRCSRMDLYRDGELIHGYTAKPTPRSIEYFAPAIEDSFTGKSTFMNALLLVKMYENRSLVVYNQSVIESEGEEFRIHSIPHKDDLPAVVEQHFSIPSDIVSEAISGLEPQGNAWG